MLILGLATASLADICGYPVEGSVRIERDGETLSVFRVGIADSPTEMQLGLMGCSSLEPGQGLLFVYPDDRERFFWMKNTPLPLALVFITGSGRIATVKMGEPLSTRTIPSETPARLVLEINPGEALRFQVGDRVDVAFD